MTPYRKLAENRKNLGHYDIQGTPNKSQVFLPFRHFGYIVLCNFSICFYNQFNLGNLVSNDDDKPKRIKLRCILLIELTPTKTQYFTGLTLALANINIFFSTDSSQLSLQKKGQLKWALPSCDGQCTGWIGPYQRYINKSATFHE